MMTARDFYRVISMIVPLYIAMFIGYGSVKWWRLFNEEQCLGISRFCSTFAVPVLSFHYITKTKLHEMNLKLLGADVLQKVIVLVVLACWHNLGPRGSMEWLITVFSICTLPNALILGLPIIKSMYHAAPLVVGIFVAQSMIWHPLLLIMYEYSAARNTISQQFDDNHGCDVEIDTTTAGREAFTGHESSHDQHSAGNEQGGIEEVPSPSTTEDIPEHHRDCNRPALMPSTSVMTKQAMKAVGEKLIKNPNTYATILGLVWVFVSSKFHIAFPLIVTRSVTFLSNASLGMGMFNMGLSIGLHPTLMPCGKVVAALIMVLRFIIGPTVMAFASLVIGLRGTIFSIAVVQAALSQGVAPSVFAVQYNVYPEVFNTGMTFGMVVVLPIALLYYNLLET